MTCAGTIQKGAGVGALAFCLHAFGLGFSQVKVFAGSDTGFKQLALALQGFLCQPDIGLCLDGISLRAAKVG